MILRRRIADALLGRMLDLQTRVSLLRKYGVTAIWMRGGQARRIAKLYRPIVAREQSAGRNTVLVLDLARDL